MTNERKIYLLEWGADAIMLNHEERCIRADNCLCEQESNELKAWAERIRGGGDS